MACSFPGSEMSLRFRWRCILAGVMQEVWLLLVTHMHVGRRRREIYDKTSTAYSYYVIMYAPAYCVAQHLLPFCNPPGRPRRAYPLNTLHLATG